MQRFDVIFNMELRCYRAIWLRKLNSTLIISKMYSYQFMQLKILYVLKYHS